MGYLCRHRDDLPRITICEFQNGENVTTFTIEADDIPPLDREDSFAVPYRKYSKETREFEALANTADFCLRSYKIPEGQAAENGVYITSKDEVAKRLDLAMLPRKDHIDGYRYLFLLSSDYIDNLDGNTRGEFWIHSRNDLIRNADLLLSDDGPGGVIVFEDIAEYTSNTISNHYPEIDERKKEHDQDVEKLKRMFLLNDEAFAHIATSINESEETILRKVYEYDAKVSARADASIKSQIEDIDSLNPEDGSYQTDLVERVAQLVETIPEQNRAALTHYVARRKLVLDLLDKLIACELENVRRQLKWQF